MAKPMVKGCIEAFIKYAESQYPREACGLIAGTQHHLDWFPCGNIQDEMHALNPRVYPEGSGKAYWIDPKNLFEIQRSLRSSGGSIHTICHSHIDADPYFSETDRQLAVCDGLPVYPGVNYLVLSVSLGKAGGYKIYAWRDTIKDFEEISLLGQ